MSKMTYQESINWLFEQLPMYQNIGSKAYKADLKNTHLLMDYLNHPYKNFKSIHVAGTNGKGSTSSLLSSVLQEAGYKVGLFTSPHLKSFRERIKINDSMISEDDVSNFVIEHQAFFEQHQLSFFEMTVGLAFDNFSKQNVDIAVIEVGLGGRLDSTNVIEPLVSVITNIDMDHTAILGDTYSKIAFEKGGIIKPYIPVIIGEYHPETFPVFEELAKKNNSEIHQAFLLEDSMLDCPLRGDYQKNNFKTVIKTIDVINENQWFEINNQAIEDGFLNVIKNTGLLGRWQILQESPMIVADTAHNEAGLKIVLNQIKKQTFHQLHMVLGFVNDKNIDSILDILPKNAKYYIAKPNVARGLDVEVLKDKMALQNLNIQCFDNVEKAFFTAKENLLPTDFLYVGGSTFVVAEIIYFFCFKKL